MVKTKRKQLIAFNDLKRRIITPGFCTLCGACEAACPVHAIKIEENKIHSILDCSKALDLCPICYDICPHSEALLLEAMGFVAEAPFRRSNLGYYRKIVLAQATERRLRELSHSGGVVTSLLMHLIANKTVDSAVVSEAEPQVSLKLRPSVALVPDDILSSVDSKFSPSSVAKAFGKAVYEYGKANIAFVGIPCHVLALRKLEAWQHKFAENLKIVIGLFCLWTFSLEHLLEYLSSAYHIKPSDIKKIDLQKEYVVDTTKGTIRIPLSEVKPHILNSCRTCVDFTSELADISVGGAHPLEDWSIVIIRTKQGEDVFNDAVKHGVIRTKNIDEEPDVFAHTVEMAIHKEKIALEEVKRLRETNRPFPPVTDRLFMFLPRETALFSSLKVEDVMTKKVMSVPPTITVSQLSEVITRHHHMGYPVTNEQKELIGIVTFEDAAKVPKEKKDEVLINDIVRRKLVVAYPDESVLEAIERMIAHKIGRILVVDRKNPKTLSGILTRTDIMHVLKWPMKAT
jgi:coenzyme F420 hydrogenase subunit beta